MQQQTLKCSVTDEANPFSLPTYSLKFIDDGVGKSKSLDFEASNASKALILAQNEASNRRAELWCDGRKLCAISRNEAGVWEIHS